MKNQHDDDSIGDDDDDDDNDDDDDDMMADPLPFCTALATDFMPELLLLSFTHCYSCDAGCIFYKL